MLAAELQPLALPPLVLVWVWVRVLRVAVLQAAMAGRSSEGGLVVLAAPAGTASPLPQPQPPSKARSRASSLSV